MPLLHLALEGRRKHDRAHRMQDAERDDRPAAFRVHDRRNRGPDNATGRIDRLARVVDRHQPHGQRCVHGIVGGAVHGYRDAVEIEREPVALAAETLHPRPGEVAGEHASGRNHNAPIGARERRDDERLHSRRARW